MAFDAREIKQLQVNGNLTSPEYPGLRITATASGYTWFYRFKSPVDGRLRQKKIGGWPETSLHSAVVEWDRLRKERDSGVDPALAARADKQAKLADIAATKAKKSRAAYTVRVVAMEYWENYVEKNRARKGSDEVKRIFDKMLGDAGDIPAVEVTRAQAFDLIQSHADTPVNAAKLRAELGAAWDWAIDAGRLPDTAPNWWRLVLRGKLKSKGKKIEGQNIGTHKRVLAEHEIGDLLRWLPNASRLLRDALTIYLWTCCRGGEILSVEGSEVRCESGDQWWWTIPKHKTKNARHAGATDHRVPLFGRAKEILLRRKEIYGDSCLFPARRRDGKIVAVEQKSIQTSLWFFQPYCNIRTDRPRVMLPVTHWSPHDLRRSSRTLLASMGCPDEIGEAILGHMLPGVLGVYNRHTYDSGRVEWLKRLSDRLESLAERN